MNPSKPEETILILEVKGGGWGINDISDDGKKLIIGEYISANESHLYLLDTQTKKLEPSPTEQKNKSYKVERNLQKIPTKFFISPIAITSLQD